MTGRHRADEPQRHIVDQLAGVGIDVDAEQLSHSVEDASAAVPCRR